jgi:hypothetical protein
MQSGMQAKGQRKRERVSACRRPIDPTPEFSKSMKKQYLSGLGDSITQLVKASRGCTIELLGRPFWNLGFGPLFQKGSHLSCRRQFAATLYLTDRLNMLRQEIPMNQMACRAVWQVYGEGECFRLA